MEVFFNPCVLQTIIICCTVIVLGIIGTSVYRIYKNQQRSWGSYTFCASILLVLTIAIFSYCFCGDRNVLDFISLASALISIILAIITIIYSFYSNSRSSGQIETLNNAAMNVKNATVLYTESAESLQENIRKIVNAINRVEEKTDMILGVNPSKGDSKTNLKNSDEFVKKFVNTSSPVGVMAMYACVRSKDKKKKWNLNIVSDNFKYAYFGGFLVAVRCAGLIEVMVDFRDGNVEVSDYSEFIKSTIEAWIKNFDFTTVEGLQELKDKIDAYFGELE